MQSLPLWSRKPSSWVRNLNHWRSLRPHPSWSTQRSLNPWNPQSRLTLSLQNPLSKLMLLLPLLLHTLCPNLATTLPGRQRNPRERLGLTQTMPASGSTHTCRRTGGGNSNLSSAPRMSTLATSKSKGWPTSKPQPSGCQVPNGKKTAGGTLHPALVCWGERTISSRRTSKESRITKRGDVKKCGAGHGPSEVHCLIWKATRVLCGAVQELCRCLTPLLERGSLLDLEMLDMARKDLVTPVPAERASSLRPRAEDPIGASASNKLPTLEPKEAGQSEELSLMPRGRPSAHPVFTLSWPDESDPST